mmetsp:Transcript_5418/g.12949  ORF Transcript_5418/g.12949 Transcript_5418/m.12949 type:complete len:170 (-) Transcript_5418:138-647(-)
MASSSSDVPPGPRRFARLGYWGSFRRYWSDLSSGCTFAAVARLGARRQDGSIWSGVSELVTPASCSRAAVTALCLGLGGYNLHVAFFCIRYRVSHVTAWKSLVAGFVGGGTCQLFLDFEESLMKRMFPATVDNPEAYELRQVWLQSGSRSYTYRVIDEFEQRLLTAPGK